MTIIDTSTAAPRSPAVFTGAGIARLITGAFDAWTARALKRDTLRKLDRLTPRELDDIGLTRADVDAMR